MINPVVIIPAFSRHKSLERLLASINRADFSGHSTMLIISLDGGATDRVLDVAEKFVFNHGSNIVVKHRSNLGLREHILWCGDQTRKHGAAIILEDDLVVDPFFYKYSVAALNFFNSDSTIGGVSLYSPSWNEYARLPFLPLGNGSSSYFMKVPSSWGQAWNYEQWEEFRNWLKLYNEDSINSDVNIPNAVKKWPMTSWKKLFAAYIVDQDKYFCYPYNSYTTNCSDPGGLHMPLGTNLFQTALPSPCREKDQIDFLTFSESCVLYDQFFEAVPQNIGYLNGIYSVNNLEIDFYGIKPLEQLKKKKFTITIRGSERPIERYGLVYKPIENNFFYPSYNDSPLEMFLTESKFIKESWNSKYFRQDYLKYFCNARISDFKTRKKSNFFDKLLEIYTKLFNF